MTLIEIVVVMALLVGLFAIAIPAYQAMFDVNMRGAARELAQTYKWLQDEAAMRNVTFRVAIDLDRGTWKVQAGDPSSLIFSTPEEREAADEDLESTMKRYTERELARGRHRAGGDREEVGRQVRGTRRRVVHDAAGTAVERAVRRGSTRPSTARTASSPARAARRRIRPRTPSPTRTSSRTGRASTRWCGSSTRTIPRTAGRSRSSR